MKNAHLLFLTGLLLAPRLPAQTTLYVPSGASGISSSSSNNVGVGTSNPGTTLEVAGTGRFTGQVTPTTNGAAVEISQAGGIGIIESYNRGTGGIPLRLYGYPTSFWGGNVGIGTASPQVLLHLSSNASPSTGFSIENTAAGGRWYSLISSQNGAFIGGGKFSLYDNTAASHRFTVDSSGNVGIGTTAPAAKLDVFSGGSMTAGGYNGQLATLQVGHTGGAAANADGATIVLSQQYSSGDPASIVRVGAIVGYKGQGDGSFGGGIKFRVQPVGANPLLDVMTLAMSGNVGIGTNAPTAKLHVVGSGFAQINPDDGALELASGNDSYSFIDFRGSANLGADFRGRIGYADGGGFDFSTAGSFAMKIAESGNVGIGTTNPSHKLAVNGTIKAKEVIVETTGWSDYVFAKGYRLAPLAEVERHILEKQHLPGIPSAADVAEQGVSVGDMQARLLAKIEELTLHQIAQEKRIMALEEENSDLRRGRSAISPHP